MSAVLTVTLVICISMSVFLFATYCYYLGYERGVRDTKERWPYVSTKVNYMKVEE